MYLEYFESLRYPELTKGIKQKYGRIFMISVK